MGSTIDSDTVRVIDALAVHKDAGGEIEVQHLSNLTTDEAVELGSKPGGFRLSHGFISPRTWSRSGCWRPRTCTPWRRPLPKPSSDATVTGPCR